MTVAVLPDRIDKRSILFEESRPDFDDHPQKYAAHDWYAAAILLVGELL